MEYLHFLALLIVLTLPVWVAPISLNRAREIAILDKISKIRESGKLPKKGSHLRELLDKYYWIIYTDVWIPPGSENVGNNGITPPHIHNQIDDSDRKCGGIQPFLRPPPANFDGNNIPGVNDQQHCGVKGETKKVWNLLKELRDKFNEHTRLDKTSIRKKLVKILGGEVAGKHEWQFLAAIEFRKGSVFAQECGATLISDQWILTAAHCFQKVDIYERPFMPKEFNTCDMRVVLREFDLSNSKDNAMMVDAVKVFIHPDFQPIGTYNDIALVKLAQRIDYAQQPGITPVCLPQTGETINTGEKCWVIGWGLDDAYSAIPSDVVQEVQLTIRDYTDCTLLDPNIRSNQLCVGEIEGGKDTCAGDSGGPLLCESRGKFYQFGITSWGAQICGYPGTGAIYSKVSDHMVWIETVLRQ